ncbi:MAG TPA: hypothetical protein VGB88_02845 [Alphaproteobacteria bacterium]
MTNIQAILAGAALIAAAALLGGGPAPQAAGTDGRFALAVAASHPIAFVTDTATGETMVCSQSGCRRLEIAEASSVPGIDPARAQPGPPAQPSTLDTILQGPPPAELQLPPPSTAPGGGSALDQMRGNF